MTHVSQISALLADFQLDAILVTSRINLQYTVGTVVFSGAALICPDAAWYITDGPPISAPDLTVQSVSSSQVPGAIAKRISDRNIRRLGFEEAEMSQALYAAYTSCCSCEWVPAQAVLQTARMKKTEEEIRRIRAVQAITDQAFLDILPDLRAGLSEHDVAGMLAHRMLANGGFTLAFPPIVASGPNGGNPHGFATDRIIQKGDFITMDFGVVMDDYGSDMTRTVAIGSATDEMRTIYETVLAAQEAGMHAAHAGITGKEIDAAGRAVIEQAGYGPYFTHGFGHGLGIEGHESPGAGQNDTTPLPAGAVVSAEPGIYLPNQLGVRIENLILLTETGYEDLNTSTRELLIL